ncbi:MAG TPA: transcriptional repressor LexA [Candidatus Paceibacterota bacterium]|nr:transcriptional repressor LexA [Candidatus Pacearchaeota archaeon]HRZ50798.1 transcriptional repressor LexA [Candidatus Paceibacterota bacterium]HSA36519.1 transcriptional repressor LexA [Candidatus Paceibacterota bacterium]
MAIPITKRQKEVLDFIKKFIKKKKYPPTLEEICVGLKLSAVSTVHQHIEALAEKGYLKKVGNNARAIDINEPEAMVRVPLLGTIAAGEPIEAVQQKEFIAVPKTKLPVNGEIYALRVIGNSMIDENINEGDVVLIKHQSTADNGQKIVALIDNHEATLKKFYKSRGLVRLEPANKNYKPIIIQKDQELSIQGIVLDVIKSGGEIKENPTLFNDEIEKDDNLPINKIICGDALHHLQKLPDQSIDLIIADPPYNLSKGNHIHFNNNGLKGFGGEWNKVMENWDNLPLVDYFKFTAKWLKEVKRILKPTGSIWVFGTYHNTGIINLIFQTLGIEIINEVVWYKRNAFPNLAGRRFTASHETLLWGHAGEKRKYYFDYKQSKEFHDPSDLLKSQGKQMRTVWDIPNNKESREIEFGKHPTQKPLSVCKRIISLCSKPDDIVLSPFAGAGSECLAAKELGRKYIGIELDEKYVDIANKRLKYSKNQQPLFN